MNAPMGSSMLRLARAWFDELSVVRVFEPLVADWQRECESKSGMARIGCRIRGAAAFAMSFTLTFATEFRKPLPIGLPAAAWWTMELFAGVGVLALYYPSRGNGVGFDFIFPSIVGVALPIAITPAAIILLTLTKWPSRDLRKAVVRTALVTTLLMIPLLGWGVPYANQQWRVHVFATRNRVATQPARGLRELTLPELWGSTPPRDLIQSPDRRRQELAQRISMILLPLPLAVLGIAAARMRRAPIAWACFWWLAAPAVFGVLQSWRGHLVLLAIAALIHRLAGYRAQAPRSDMV